MKKDLTFAKGMDYSERQETLEDLMYALKSAQVEVVKANDDEVILAELESARTYAYSCAHDDALEIPDLLLQAMYCSTLEVVNELLDTAIERCQEALDEVGELVDEERDWGRRQDDYAWSRAC